MTAKAEEVTRFKETIALREGETMLQDLVEDDGIRFGIVAVELK